MTKVLFAPGFGEGLADRDYASTMNAIAQCGYEVEVVAIRWARTTIVDWVAQVQDIYSSSDPENTVLAGFSFGAMTALALAAEVRPVALLLLSPQWSLPHFSRGSGDQKPERFARTDHS